MNQLCNVITTVKFHKYLFNVFSFYSELQNFKKYFKPLFPSADFTCCNQCPCPKTTENQFVQCDVRFVMSRNRSAYNIILPEFLASIVHVRHKCSVAVCWLGSCSLRDQLRPHAAFSFRDQGKVAEGSRQGIQCKVLIRFRTSSLR